MPYSLDNKLVVAITSRALFDLEAAHKIFECEGLAAYRVFQLKEEEKTLGPGTGFPLVRALLNINKGVDDPLVEVVLITRNDADSGFRILNSIEAEELDITRAAFTDGRDPYRYLGAFSCDLFLSAHPEDVRAALKAGFAAALVYPPPKVVESNSDEVRIALDGDAVLFSDKSEKIFQRQGLEAFLENEQMLEDVPLDPGPFKGFVEAISRIQRQFPEDECPIRTALITARSGPAHKRVIKTLRAWKIRLDESFFLGGIEKVKILQAFRPHIFFDDQKANLAPASSSTPAAQVLTNDT